MSSSDLFQFVRIPADESSNLEVLEADKAGGLTDDALVKHARTSFYTYTGAKARAEQLETLSEEERKQLAAKIRQQVGSQNPTVNSMDDETVVNMIYRSQMQPSCDISALTVPTQANNHRAVSMYATENAKAHGLPPNPRATALMAACGHIATDGGVFGDVFVGRAIDDEVKDIWERVDFTVSDADPASDWCRIARGTGGGGGSGRAAASSLSNLVQQQTTNLQIVDGGTRSQGDSLYGMNGAPPVQELWGFWSQTEDEVELHFIVPAGTKAKYCKVNFGRNKLKITLTGQTLLQGETFDPIEKDESTFTLQSNNNETLDLCVTLSKTETGRIWPWVVK